MTSAVRVAMAQLCPVSGDVSANLALARQAIAQAAAESAVLVVFPSCYLADMPPNPTSADLTLPDLSGLRRTWRAITSLYACLFQCYVIFVNLVGTDHGWVFAGGSHVVGPHGEVIAEASRDREELLVADLDLGSVLEVRRTTPLSRNPRLDLVHREAGRLLGPDLQRLKGPGMP